MSVERRIEERRRLVAEERSRRRVLRLLAALALTSLIGAVVWVFHSPWLSVGTLEVTGVSSSDTARVLAEAGVTVGRPLFLIRATEVESRLTRDRWVAAATVDVDWPRTVRVTVEERTPLAWVELEDGWRRLAVDGVAVSDVEPFDLSMPRLRFTGLTVESAPESRDLLGALELVSTLGQPWAAGTELWVDETEMWGEVSGFTVRLGRATDMAAKARTLVALLEQRPDPGSVINVMSAANPTVLPAGDGSEGGGDGSADVDPESPDNTQPAVEG